MLLLREHKLTDTFYLQNTIKKHEDKKSNLPKTSGRLVSFNWFKKESISQDGHPLIFRAIKSNELSDLEVERVQRQCLPSRRLDAFKLLIVASYWWNILPPANGKLPFIALLDNKQRCAYCFSECFNASQLLMNILFYLLFTVLYISIDIPNFAMVQQSPILHYCILFSEFYSVFSMFLILLLNICCSFYNSLCNFLYNYFCILGYVWKITSI